MDIKEYVRLELLKYLAESGMRKDAVAERIGVHPSQLSTYLAGRVVPNTRVLLKMQKELGIKIFEADAVK